MNFVLVCLIQPNETFLSNYKNVQFTSARARWLKYLLSFHSKKNNSVMPFCFSLHFKDSLVILCPMWNTANSSGVWIVVTRDVWESEWCVCVVTDVRAECPASAAGWPSTRCGRGHDSTLPLSHISGRRCCRHTVQACTLSCCTCFVENFD